MDLGIGSRVRHKELGVGVLVQISCEYFIITFVHHGVKEIARLYAEDELEVLEKAAPIEDLVSLETVETALQKIVGRITDEMELTDLGGKWEGGTLILKPANDDLKPHELPISTFFHKVVMVRDRLRVMEQRINSSGLTGEEKVNLQQYITKIYGSLTSFNVLFTSKQEGFIGSGSN